MPRSRQYQPPQAPNAQAYGQRGDQMAAQRAMPLPRSDSAADAAAAAPAGPPSSAPPPDVPPAPNPNDPMLLQMARDFDPGITPLDAPSDRPDEPITTGLTTGPGPGPEAIFTSPDRGKRAADVLRMLSYSSGSEMYAELANRIEGHGGLV